VPTDASCDNPANIGVHDCLGNTKSKTAHRAGCVIADSREGKQIIETLGHRAAMAGDYYCGCLLEPFCPSGVAHSIPREEHLRE
jgi:hypothetical protein